jgi:hypothetical protein
MFHIFVGLVAATVAMELALLLRRMWQRWGRAKIDKRSRG